MDKLSLIKNKKGEYELNINGEEFSLFKKGVADISIVDNDVIECFDLQFKNFKMPTLSFYVGENGSYNVSYNSTQPIGNVVVTVTNNEAVLTIPDGAYTINSVTFESNSCVKTYNTPIEVNCPVLPFCNCSGTNNGDFTIISITPISGDNYSLTFNACNVGVFEWEVVDISNQVIKTGSIIPTSGTITINLSGVGNGTYNLRAFSSVCQGEAVKTFTISNVIPTENLRKLVVFPDNEIDGVVYNIQKQVGIDVIGHLGLHWGMIERTQDNYNFGELNYILNKYKQDGFKTILWLKPFHCFTNAINSWNLHNLDGNIVNIEANSTSYLPSTSWERDRYGRRAAEEYDFGHKGKFTYSDEYAINRYLMYVARTCHYINSHINKDVIEGVGIIDGTYNETGFFSQSTSYQTGSPWNYPFNTDLGYADIDFTGFRAFLQNKYPSISNLNSSWGTSFVSFAQITKDNISKPTEYSNGNDIGYADNNTTKDLYDYKVQIHKNLYTRFVNAVKNPSSVINGLTNNTGIKTFAYITENFTSGQGRTWGVASLVSMYSMFDAYLSSCTSGSSPIHTNSYLGELQLRQCTFLGTFPNKEYGFEQDYDPVENSWGVTKTASNMLGLGVKYHVLALQDTQQKWDRNVISDNGDNRTLKDDVIRAKQTFYNNQNVTTPLGWGVLEYTEVEALNNPFNPANVKSQWIADTGVNSGSLAPIKFIKCKNNNQTSPTVTISSSAKNTFDTFLNNNKSFYNNNLQVIIGNENGEIYRYVSGNKPTTEGMWIASLSKWYLGALVSKAVQDGVIGWNTTLGSLVPSFEFNGKGTPTLKQLMTHTGGWPETSAAYSQDGEPWENKQNLTLEQAADNIATTVPLSSVGTSFVYSGVGMQLAGRMLEVAYNLPILTIIQNLLVNPLLTTSTTFFPFPFQPSSNPLLASGLSSNIEDFGKFMRMILSKNSILNSNSTNFMEIDQTGIGAGYGIGVYTNFGNQIYFHQGGLGHTAWIDRKKNIWGLIFTYESTPSSANNKSPEFLSLVNNTNLY